MLPTTPFAHGSECPIWKADKAFQPEWEQDLYSTPGDTNLWIRQCQCSKEYHRVPRTENRPPQPAQAQHRHGDVLGTHRACTVEADFKFDGTGPNGRWQSFCSNCGTRQWYLPPGFDPEVMKGFIAISEPPIAHQLPDFDAIERGRAEALKKHKRAEILDALGLDEADLGALLTTVRAMVKQPSKKAS